MAQEKKKFVIALTLIYAVIIAIVISTYRDYGISWDEEFYRDSGKLYLQHFFDDNLIAEKIREYHQETHGALVDVLYYLPLHWWGNDQSFEDLHLVKGLIGSLTLVFVALTLRMLGIRWWLAIGGMLLLATQPRWWGDLFDNFMDISAGLVVSLQLLIGVWTIKQLEKKLIPRWPLLLGLKLSAIVGAVGFSHRPALGAIFAAECIVLLWQWFVIKRNWKTGFIATTFLAVVFSVALVLVDPYVRKNGFMGVVQKIDMSLNFYVHHGSQLFEEKYIFSKDLPWYYLPKWIVISTPLPALGLALLGSLELGRQIFRRQKVGGWEIVFLSFWLPFIIVVGTRPVLYDAWRHFLWLTVPVTLVAVRGADVFYRKVTSPRSLTKFVRYSIPVGLIGYFFIMIITMKTLHPYEYVYFNALVGGLQGAFEKYETDYWGKTQKESVLWLRNHELAGKEGVFSIKTCATRLSSAYYFSEYMSWVPTLSDADYFVCFTRHNDYKQVSNKNTLHVVERQGVPLNYVKRVR